MFTKALKFTTGLAAAVVIGSLEGAEENNENVEEFSDGQDGIRVNGDDMTRAEAETKKNFGELHAKYFR